MNGYLCLLIMTMEMRRNLMRMMGMTRVVAWEKADAGARWNDASPGERCNAKVAKDAICAELPCERCNV